ncbi:unnamed protein product, partial [Rangifer tarandus platyrhynchus]
MRSPVWGKSPTEQRQPWGTLTQHLGTRWEWTRRVQAGTGRGSWQGPSGLASRCVPVPLVCSWSSSTVTVP